MRLRLLHLLLPLALLFSQQGAVWHELAHLTHPSHPVAPGHDRIQALRDLQGPLSTRPASESRESSVPRGIASILVRHLAQAARAADYLVPTIPGTRGTADTGHPHGQAQERNRDTEDGLDDDPGADPHAGDLCRLCLAYAHLTVGAAGSAPALLLPQASHVRHALQPECSWRVGAPLARSRGPPQAL